MKKTILTIAAIVMCVSAFTSCTIGNNTGTIDPTAAVTTQKPEESTEEVTNDDSRPSLLTNANLTLPGEYPIAAEMESISLGIAQSSTVVSYAYGENFQTTWMQDKFNVKFDLVLFPATDANQKLELMIASNAELPDILAGDTLGFKDDNVRYKYGEAGAIIPLNDYFEQLGYHFSAAAESAVNDPTKQGYMTADEVLGMVTSPDGNIYGMPYWVYSLQNSYSIRSWINEEWLDTLGLDMPTTTDELVATLIAFRDQDPNGNGKKDEIPMISSTDGWRTDPIALLMNAFVYTSDLTATNYYYQLKNGQITASFDTEEWKNGLKFIKSLVEQKLLSDLSFTQDFSQYKAMVSAETPIVGIGVSGSISGFGDNKTIYTGLPAIEGPEGVKYATYIPQLPDVREVITRDCGSPDLAFRVLDSGYDIESGYCMILRYGEPGVDFEFTDEGNVMYADLGYTPYFKTLNNIWGTSQQSMWENVPLPTFRTSTINQGEVWDGDTSNNEYKNSLAVKGLYQHIPATDEIISKIIYTDAEVEQFSEIRTVLNSYILESAVRFVLGDLDMDKDWDSYLNELEKIGYKELIAADQIAYDRTMGK